jgi:hypothetical protein
MNHLKHQHFSQVVLGEVAGKFLNEFIVHIACGDWRRSLAKFEGNVPIFFGEELEDDWMDVAEIKGVNRSSLVPFAGHDPEV